jgi:hypothetical protein
MMPRTLLDPGQLPTALATLDYQVNRLFDGLGDQESNWHQTGPIEAMSLPPRQRTASSGPKSASRPRAPIARICAAHESRSLVRKNYIQTVLIASGSRRIQRVPEPKPRTYCSNQGRRSVSPSRERDNLDRFSIAEYVLLQLRLGRPNAARSVPPDTMR